MLRLIRLNSWWNTIVPQVLGWIYFAFLSTVVFEMYHEVPYSPNGGRGYAEHGFFFSIALVAIACFGYLLNDWCDVETDLRSGKPNSIAARSKMVQILLVFTPLIMGLISWAELNLQGHIWGSYMPLANCFLALQIIALIIYSAKPFRLKDRAEWGVIADAFYGHLNPVLITITVFGFKCWWQPKGIWDYFFVGLLILLCFIKGIRNILLHQIEDRKKDGTSKINTVVLKYGPWRVINFINHYLFPAEIFSLVCLTLVMSVHIPPLILPLIFFVIVSYLKFSGWKLGYADRRLVEFKFSYFMNDYYEGWLPVFMLIILSVYRHEFVFLLILHLILFPMFIIKLVRDFKAIRENFKTEEDY